MCSQCDEFDRKIARYREIAKQAFDRVTVERIDKLVADLEQRRAALHSKPS